MRAWMYKPKTDFNPYAKLDVYNMQAKSIDAIRREVERAPYPHWFWVVVEDNNLIVACFDPSKTERHEFDGQYYRDFKPAEGGAE